ncbi:MAG: orotidine-5'-phosphate decarboxylase [Candidatus Roizmanbacteria bacterium]|nr:orotidine-5'-phosphate decarboxylase [Candidatus Roizmanbacteria bacterium]
MITFQQKLDMIVKKNQSLLCVGLDSDINKIPDFIRNGEHPQSTFNKLIIDATHDLVCAYKPNSAFYEARGEEGIKELKMTCDYLKNNYLEIPIILDAKRADIGSTNKGYIKYAYDYLGVDAITVHPYLGREALQPFLDLKDKGCIILCKTSNLGSDEFQNLYLSHGRGQDRKPLYQIVAENVVNKWNTNKNCLLVVGATYPDELKQVRKIIGDMTLLIPGIGAQGGDLEATLKAGLNSKKQGLIINSSRGIIFAKSPRDEAKKLKQDINQYRK